MTGLNTEKPLGIIFPTWEESNHESSPLKKSDLLLYTDESKIQHAASAGIPGSITKMISFAISLGMHGTILQAINCAIVMCATTLIEKSYINRRIAIVTCSQAALGTLQSYKMEAGQVRDYICRRNELGTLTD